MSTNCSRTEQCIADADLNHVLLSRAFLQDAGMIKDCNWHNYFWKCNRIHIFSDIRTVQPISSTLSSHPVLRLHAPILNQRTQHARMQRVHSCTAQHLPPPVWAEGHRNDCLSVTSNGAGAACDCSDTKHCLRLVHNLHHLLCVQLLHLLQGALQCSQSVHCNIIDWKFIRNLFFLQEDHNGNRG